jgi:hypothetical protein
MNQSIQGLLGFPACRDGRGAGRCDLWFNSQLNCPKSCVSTHGLSLKAFSLQSIYLSSYKITTAPDMRLPGNPAGRRLRPKPEFKARESRGVRRTPCTPQRLRDEAQRRNRAFGQSSSRTDGFAQSPSSRRASLAQVRRTPCTPQRLRDEAQRRNRAFGEAVTSVPSWGLRTPSSRRIRCHPPDCRPCCL